jgi:hypothetical protein
MEFSIPVVDEDVSTDDAGESGKNIVGAILGFLTLFGVVGAASYAYNQVRDAVGVDETSIPGV